MIILIVFGVIAGYIAIAYYTTRTLSRWAYSRTYKESSRWIIGTISVLFFVLLPMWDILIERVYMYYQCNKIGGAHVYHTVIADRKYFDDKGYPQFKFEGNNSMCLGEDCYLYDIKHTHVFSVLYKDKGIHKSVNKYTDPRSGKVLGEYIHFIHYTRYSLGHSDSVCPPEKALDRSEMRKQIFVATDVSQ